MREVLNFGKVTGFQAIHQEKDSFRGWSLLCIIGELVDLETGLWGGALHGDFQPM
jgi:hypothetical protein